MKKEYIQKSITSLKKRIKNNFGKDTEFYLFGSAARGDYKEDSDIDLLILLSRTVDNSIREEIFNNAFDVELEHNVIFGLIVHSKDFWNSEIARVMPIYQNIKNEGIKV
ncbi:MAG: nucleotidyltransferase domain-containing protein [Candidatus Cloacimonetes bacterium]|nr:nucleotidyltransferase domain-containing protein [Candidatus Cloacimonadota bacterium]